MLSFHKTVAATLSVFLLSTAPLGVGLQAAQAASANNASAAKNLNQLS